MDYDKNMMGMMKECMRGCRVCSLVPVTLGILAFIFGYFLDAEIVQILWLIFSAMITLFGFFAFLMISLFLK
jgi:hypothetical protein